MRQEGQRGLQGEKGENLSLGWDKALVSVCLWRVGLYYEDSLGIFHNDYSFPPSARVPRVPGSQTHEMWMSPSHLAPRNFSLA